jgi:hypothetical protein
LSGCTHSPVQEEVFQITWQVKAFLHSGEEANTTVSQRKMFLICGLRMLPDWTQTLGLKQSSCLLGKWDYRCTLLHWIKWNIKGSERSFKKQFCLIHCFQNYLTIGCCISFGWFWLSIADWPQTSDLLASASQVLGL